VRAGKLNKRVELLEPTDTRDDYGGVDTTWATWGWRWASIEPLQGREAFQAQTISASTTHKVTMRYFDGLTTKWRIVFNGRTFEIVSAINTNERGREWVCMCAEAV